jgi:hypothetical protein
VRRSVCGPGSVLCGSGSVLCGSGRLLCGSLLRASAPLPPPLLLRSSFVLRSGGLRPGWLLELRSGGCCAHGCSGDCPDPGPQGPGGSARSEGPQGRLTPPRESASARLCDAMRRTPGGSACSAESGLALLPRLGRPKKESSRTCLRSGFSISWPPGLPWRQERPGSVFNLSADWHWSLGAQCGIS